jgi:DNA replication and repair protein RecF
MGFLTLKTHNFRNIGDTKLDVDAAEVFLIGENGQGKTNLLEAVYMLCFGSSFRVRNDRVLVDQGSGEPGFWLFAEYSMSHTGMDSVALAYEEGKKAVTINGKTVSDRRDLVGNIPCVVFSHEDMAFVNGPPERRRWFFNQVMSLHDPLFIDTLRTYTKVLRLRNTALKQDQTLARLYDEQLAGYGFELISRRREAVLEFNETFRGLFTSISGLSKECLIRYRPSWKSEGIDGVLDELRNRQDADRTMRTTTSGPHRDRFMFMVDGRDFSKVASTGQLRLISLILRVAQAVFFQEKTGRKPVLLLDDVLLELDAKKRISFLEMLPEYEQAFYTFLPDEPFERYRGAKTLLYRVVDGTFDSMGETDR